MSRRSVPGSRWVQPWVQLAEIAVSAPVVIGYRTARMVTGGWPPNARDRREYTRMVSEKVQALTEVATVAVLTPPRDVLKTTNALLRPVHRRVVANRKRLAKH